MGIFSRPRRDDPMITALHPGEIFVFGSNSAGNHTGGAARQAARDFGAVMGQPRGLQGQSYAIVSMDGLEILADEARRFLEFARAHPELSFLVTEIGCGIAGYTPSQVAPFFSGAPSNVQLPRSFSITLANRTE